MSPSLGIDLPGPFSVGARLLQRRRQPVCGLGGVEPQPCRTSPIATGFGEYGCVAIAGGGTPGGAGPYRPFTGAANTPIAARRTSFDVGVVGDGLERVQVVVGDRVDHLLAVTGEGGPQVRRDRQVAGLAVPAGQVS